jgi:hypothetical protein
MVWALSGAPIANVNEYAVLGKLAENAGSDGCNAFPSVKTVAELTTLSERTVTRTLRSLEERRLIAKGNQDAARIIRRADLRPTVYDLLIPYDCFANVDQVNANRIRFGLEPLTRDNRPPIAPPPAKKERADKGVKRPREDAADEMASGTRPEDTGGLVVTPSESGQIGHGVTTSPERGDYKSGTGCLEVTRTVPMNQPGEPSSSVRSSVAIPSARETNEWTNDVDPQETGGGGADQAGSEKGVPATPGIFLLMSFGSEYPLYRLTGQPLFDQGRAVDGLLAAGWTPEKIREHLTAWKLPTREEIKISPAAVISARLKAMAQGTPFPAAGANSAETDAPTICPDHVDGVRIRIDPETEVPYRCPDCHPLAASVAAF